MEQIFLGATIGRALEALLGAVSQARESAHMYESILAQLENTIRTITPKLNEIERLSDEDFPDDVIQRIHLQLIRGKELVDKCSKVGCCNNLCMSQRYYKKLQELDDSLRRLITIDLQVKVALDVIRISAEIRALCKRWDQMDVQEKGGTSVWIFKPSASKVLGKFSGLKRLVQTVQYAPKRIFMNLVSVGLWQNNRSFVQTYEK